MTSPTADPDPGYFYKAAWSFYLFLAIAGVLWVGFATGDIDLGLFVDLERWWQDLLVGLVAGTIFLVFIPLIGSIIGAIAGAGVGAVVAERGIAKRPWDESIRSGKGAAVGRALSTVIKGCFAVVAAVVLIVFAFVN